MNDILKSRIEERLAALGKTARGASLEVSDNADLIRNVLTGKSEQPRIDTMAKIAAALQTTPEWLAGRTDQMTAPITGELRPANVTMPPIGRLPNDVPVKGTAAGSHLSGAFQIDEEAIDWVRRPPGLMGARDLYALYVEGFSMVPEHNPGDLRFVHPGRPARIGDSVVVQLQYNDHDGVQGMIGHLAKRTEKAWFIGKLNPAATIELKREYVLAVHKVLTTNELFGL